MSGFNSGSPFRPWNTKKRAACRTKCGTKQSHWACPDKCKHHARGESMKDPVSIFGCWRGFQFRGPHRRQIRPTSITVVGNRKLISDRRDGIRLAAFAPRELRLFLLRSKLLSVVKRNRSRHFFGRASRPILRSSCQTSTSQPSTNCRAAANASASVLASIGL